jgi:hypothetical protein
MIGIAGSAAQTLLIKLMEDIIGNGALIGEVVTISIYDGVRPNKVSDGVTTQVLLGEIKAAPSMGAANNHVTYPFSNTSEIAELIISGQFLTIADGTATWFRLYSELGGPIFDGDISDFAGSGNLKLSTTNIVTGIFMKVNSVTITIPHEH